ncbi:fibronectin type III domain-containing protein [candidate division KSB1 bacterium]|nr:fibronectin type III domain-containing protein [candidate division KSB1 bacterium]
MLVEKKYLYFTILMTTVFTCLGFSQTNGIISDAVIIPQEYDTFAPPLDVASVYTDPAFGTVVRRVTNCERFNQELLGGYFSNSEICYFNIDGSYFVAAENEIMDNRLQILTFLYNGVNGARIKMLGIYADELRPYFLRWALADRYKQNGQYIYFDPVYCFYVIKQNRVELWDVRHLDNKVVIREFLEYNQIGPGGGEGDVSDDGRYMVLDGDAKELFVYDLIDDIKYPVSTFDLGSLGAKENEVGADYATISSSGQYVILAWATDPGLDRRYAGIEVYDKEWNFQRQVHPGIIHWETGIDAFGDEVIYTVASFGYNDYYAQFGVSPGDIISVRLSDGHIRLLKKIPKWAHFTMSACNSVTDGTYLYVSYGTNSEDPEELWHPFWGEILEVPTDGSGEVRRLVHHRSRRIPNKIDKYYQADAVVDRQGTKILFRSTYISNVGDLYMINIGSRNGDSNDDTPPNPPTGLQSPNNDIDHIELAWEAPSAAPDGDFAVYYKIYRDGELVAEVYNLKFVDSGLTDDTAYQYQVFSVDKAGLTSIIAASGTFTTHPDAEPPELNFVRVENRSQIKIGFSEPADSISAVNPFNYNIESGIDVLSAVFLENKTTVLLTTTLIDLGIEYVLYVSNVSDQSKNKNVIAPDTHKSFRLLSDFYDDFENGIYDNWTFYDINRWSHQLDEGDYKLCLCTTNYDNPGDKRLGEYALVAQSKYITSRFRLNFRAKSLEDVLANNDADYAVLFGYIDEFNYNYVQFHHYDVCINRIENGDRVFLQKYPLNIEFEQYQEIEIVCTGDSLIISVNGGSVPATQFPLSFAGQIGVGSYNDAVLFDNVNIEILSPDDIIPPNSPQNLALVKATETSIEMAWEPPTIAADSDIASYYKIYRDNVYLASIVETKYVDNDLNTGQSYHYSIYAVDDNANTSEYPETQVFSTKNDTTMPSVVYINAVNRYEIEMLFTEALQIGTVLALGNYFISNGVQVVHATLLPDNRTVILQTTEMNPELEYQLSLENLMDLAGNTISPGTVVLFRLTPDYFEDFEQGLLSGWDFYHPENWNIEERNGNNGLTITTADFESPGDKLLGEYALVDRPDLVLRNFRLNCLVQSLEDTDVNRHADFAVIFSYLDSLNYHYVQFHPYNVGIHRIQDGYRTLFEAFSLELPFERPMQVGVELKNDSLQVLVDENSVFSLRLPFVQRGKLGIGAFNDAAFFDNIWIKNIAKIDTLPPSPPTGLQLLLLNK